MEIGLVSTGFRRFDGGMKMISSLLAFALLVGMAKAAEMKISGPEIEKLLIEKSYLQIKPQTQYTIEQIFLKGGITHFIVDGDAQTGMWKVEGDKYCSAWPPSKNWDCYDILLDGSKVIFLSAQGARYVQVPKSP
jgi:hypothetical protein